jgi:hypothetical protein
LSCGCCKEDGSVCFLHQVRVFIQNLNVLNRNWNWLSYYLIHRHYVHEVRNLPTEYVFEPWKAPADLQRNSGCVVGVNYPNPIVNHLEQKRICVARLHDFSTKLGAGGEDQPRLIKCLWYA